MLSIQAIGSAKYYLELAREDYYLEGGEPVGRWWGRGTKELDLPSTVSRDHLEGLVRGFSPQGDPLVQNAGTSNRQAGWDLTFSAPKSVSVLWSHAKPKLRRAIQEAHDRAVSAALAYLEADIAFTRRGKGGAQREHAGVVAATFQHGTSRALDPHLHTHALVLNLAARKDGTLGTVLSSPFYTHKTTIGTLYRVELAHELKCLGFSCDRDKTSFAVRGVPKKLTEHFSKRRAAIEAELASRGLETASAAAVATLATRQIKDLVPPRKELFRTWQKDGKALGFTADSVRRLLGTTTHAISKRHYDKALAQAVQNITTKQSHFSSRELLLHVARASQGRSLNAAYLHRAVTKTLKHDPTFVELGQRKHETRYTTADMLALEKKLLSAVTRSKTRKSHPVSARTVEAVIRRYLTERNPLVEEAKHHGRQLANVAREAAQKSFPTLRKPSKTKGFLNLPPASEPTTLDRARLRKDAARTLSNEQAQAIRHLTQTPGTIKVLSGYAGTGKTFLLNASREIWEREGYTVIGACLSAQAARELAAKSGIASDTLKMLELRTQPELSYRLKHHGRQLLRAARGKPTYKLTPLSLSKKTVLVVDEAGMIGTKQMKRLVDLAAKTGSKLVLTGEAEQLQPIEAGGPYSAIARIVGDTRLTEIRRQPQNAERRLVLDVRAGRAERALRYLAQNDRLVVAANRAAAIKQLVSDWGRDEAKAPKESLIFCPTNRDRAEINHRCQALLARAGLLDTSHPMKLHDAAIHKGDRVILRQNARKLGVQNGAKGTVVETNRFLKTLTVSLDEGRHVTLPLRSYKIRYGHKRGQSAVELGYAVTTHAGQGATVKRAYVLAGGTMQDRELTYVEVSRHIENVCLYTDRYEAQSRLSGLITQIQRSRKKDLAHDVIHDAEKHSSPGTDLSLDRARC